MEAIDSRDVPPETQEQLLDEARVETARAIDEGWEPATIGDTRLVAPQATHAHTWSPIDLLEFVDFPPEPPTIGGLVYPGRRHVFSGEPETLKTWAADVLCAEQIRAGREVVYIDFEMGAREQAARLRSLGLSNEELARFLYVAPSEPLTDVIADFESLLGIVKPPLVIVDAFTGALEIHGADPNSGVEVERFYRTIIAPMQRHGAAVVLLDHVTKNRETRGKYSIGTERKLGGADVHLGFELVRPFGHGKSGLAKIITHKDRPGQLPRPRAAELELTSDAESGGVSWQWRVPADEDSMHRWRPTALMERVSMYVGACVAEQPSRTAVEEAVKGKREYVRDAIDALLADGYMVEEDGPRGARLLRSLNQFREDDVESSAAA